MATQLPGVFGALANNSVTPEMIAKYAQTNPQLAQMLQTRYNSTQFMNQQSPEDQAAIRATWTGAPATNIGRNNAQDQWYNNAVQAGSAPANSRPAVQPQPPPPTAPPPQPAGNNAPAQPPAAQPHWENFAGGASAIGDMMTNNFAAPAIKPAAAAAAAAPAAPAAPATQPQMGYDEAKKKYGAQEAMARQGRGEVGY
jgi:hypothetical protein